MSKLLLYHLHSSLSAVLFSCYLNIPVFLSAHARPLSRSKPAQPHQTRRACTWIGCRVVSCLFESSLRFRLPAPEALPPAAVVDG